MKKLFLPTPAGIPNWALWLLLLGVIPVTILYIPTLGHGRLEGWKLFWIGLAGFMAASSAIYNLTRRD